MRAVIHAGLHKTGTTSFQRCCYDLQEELLKQQIHYPHIEGQAHHNRLVGGDDLDWLKPLVRTTRQNVGESGCLLISAENLEYALHTDKPERIEKALEHAGIKDVIWVLCFREPFSAYRSVYTQLSSSAHNLKLGRASLEFEAAGRLIATNGTLCIQNRFHLQRFHFNYPRLVQDLRLRLKGLVVGMDFKLFTKQAQAPGDLLISALSAEAKNLSELSDNLPTHTNRSYSAKQVERNYVHRFFAFDPNKHEGEPDYIKQAIKARLKKRLKAERKIEQLFKKDFEGWEQAITPTEELHQLLRR